MEIPPGPSGASAPRQVSARTTVTTAAAENQNEPRFLLVVGEGVLSTTALPAVGTVVIGRAAECEIRIDHGSISRMHAVLQLTEPLQIQDAGSANGTWVRNQRLEVDTPMEIGLNEAVRLGSVTLIVQQRSTRVDRRRIRSHDYFEDRLEDECARAFRNGLPFVIAYVVIEGGAASDDALAECLHEADVVAAYAPDELELLFVDAESVARDRLVQHLETELATRGIAARVGAAWYPRDGRDPSALVGRARARALGDVAVATDRGELVVVDERMNALHEMIARVAVADISVLLQGETGVGKEVFADQLHRLSPRALKPFVKLNCAAMTETLLESELFGHERGSFTGADKTKPGLLEVADGGVLFLDEIGEMPTSTQAKLLRVLDEGKLRRVGALAPRPIDIRLVSATNRDLEAAVRDGTFRLDLLYRLNAVSIIVPPLRERPTEIEPLARRFLYAIATKLGRPLPRLASDALALLRQYRWPGNLRELRNVMERAMVLSTGDVIGAGDLPADKMRVPLVRQAELLRPTVESREPSSVITADERQLIVDALETCHGNQTHAARLLGIARRTLLNKLEKFAVPRPRKRP